MICQETGCIENAVVMCSIPCAGSVPDHKAYCKSCAIKNGFCVVCGRYRYLRNASGIPCSICESWIRNQKVPA
jgi:hypothetical protein